jgi:hypothetical protein
MLVGGWIGEWAGGVAGVLVIATPLWIWSYLSQRRLSNGRTLAARDPGQTKYVGVEKQLCLENPDEPKELRTVPAIISFVCGQPAGPRRLWWPDYIGQLDAFAFLAWGAVLPLIDQLWIALLGLIVIPLVSGLTLRFAYSRLKHRLASELA